MNSAQFREKVQTYRRPTGHTQEELASLLGIQRQVLTRKFSGDRNAHFTHTEIKQIVKTLVEWDAITQRAQALELLALMDLPSTSFSPAEWAASPLAKLEKEDKLDTRSLSTVNLQRQIPVAHAYTLPVPLTGLIGREWLIRRAREKLLQPHMRLLTLVGPGGIGKTRLSLEIGRRLRDEFQQVVCFIDLSSLTEASQLPAHMAQGLGLAPGPATGMVDDLQKYLANRRLLLILDNFEQVLPASALISQLLQAAPELKMLVTSRVVLQIYGESELGVPPLELPNLAGLPDTQDFKALLQFEAIQLFITRAQAVQPTFELNSTNYEEVVRLCVLLEGLPLSLEMAAARVKLMPLSYLYQRLSHSKLEILSKSSRNLPARQQTLRATIDWSYNLLEEESRRLFNGLGIFRGSFSLEAVEQVCYLDNPAPDLLENLDNLIDHSLLKSVEGIRGEPRFVMLEILREYAVEKLCETGELEKLQASYVHYYLKLVERLTVNFKIVPDDRQGVTGLLEQDFDNFQAAQYLAGSSVELEEPQELEIVGHGSIKDHDLIQLERSILIQRPLEEVFNYICRFENTSKWHNLVKEIYPLEPGPLRTGMRVKAVSSIMGRRFEPLGILTEYQPYELIELQMNSGSVKLTIRFNFKRDATQTNLSLMFINNFGNFFRFTHPILTRIASTA